MKHDDKTMVIWRKTVHLKRHGDVPKFWVRPPLCHCHISVEERGVMMDDRVVMSYHYGVCRVSVLLSSCYGVCIVFPSCCHRERRANLAEGLAGDYPNSKVNGANMGPTWVLSVPDGTHVDRGQQLRFPYTSPGESEHYGSISLTFYPTTSRLLVQGSSYLMWVEEHLPVICEQAEHRYMQDASSWTALARRRGIAIKREGRYVRNLRSSRSSWSDDSIPAPEPSLSDLQQKSCVSPADAFCATAVPTDGLVPCNPIPLPALSAGSPSTHHSRRVCRRRFWLPGCLVLQLVSHIAHLHQKPSDTNWEPGFECQINWMQGGCPQGWGTAAESREW